MYKTFSSLPEQIVLLAGSRETFAALIDDVSMHIPVLEQQSLARFTVDDAQNLLTFNLERAPGSWARVYFDVFVADAAEVLLKTLEEPREGITIVLVTPHPYLIPQTIRSRVRLISETLLMDTPPYLASKAAVLAYVKETFGADSDEDASVRRAQATVFLDALEAHVRSSPDKSRIVYEAKDMLFNANMPTKQVVEYVVSMVF
jgi:DNA polymerase III delta prime subunit